jgi:hypothetical protein
MIRFKVASGMIKFLAGSCLSGLGIVLKKPKAIQVFKGKLTIKQRRLLIVRAGSFITSPYLRVLSAFGVIFQQKFNYT